MALSAEQRRALLCLEFSKAVAIHMAADHQPEFAQMVQGSELIMQYLAYHQVEPPVAPDVTARQHELYKQLQEILRNPTGVIH